MEPYVDPETGELVDGLVDLCVSISALDMNERPKPLSLDQADKFGHVDPVMWETCDSRPPLTLKDNMGEIMSLVRRLRITEDTITGRSPYLGDVIEFILMIISH